MTPRTALALLALAGLAVAACGSDDDGNESTADADLTDRAFASTDVTGHDLVEGSEITLAFADGSIGANAGCNSMNGPYTIDGDVLTAGPFASTMMACPDPLMEQDTWLVEFLSGSPTVALDGTTLTLTGDDATITLAEIEPAPLVGPTWTVTGTVANTGVSTVPTGAAASLTFADDGTVAVDTGCNTGSGEVEVSDATLVFGPIAITQRACVDDAVNQLEAQVLSVLQGEVAYEIDGDSLSLRSGEGADEIGLQLTADV